MTNPRNNPKGFWHKEQNLTKISGRWDITGVAGVVDNVVGHGFTVARDAANAGNYIITFTDGFACLLQAQANVIADSGGGAIDLYAQLGAFTPGASGACTLVVRTKAIGVSTDPTATDGVCFEATLYGEDLEGY